MKNKIVLAMPFVALVCFGLLAYFPAYVLTDSELFPHSIIPLVTLLGAGLVSVLIGGALGIVFASRRKQPLWLLVTLGCVVSLFLLASAIIRAIPGPSH